MNTINFRLPVLTFFLLTIFACSYAQKGQQLSPKEFSKAMLSEGAQLLDVRTAEEFEEEHLDGAINIDWQGDSFNEEIATSLDKTKPVYVYCRSGKRSAEAAAHLRNTGFKTVFELQGGIVAWQKELLQKAPAKETDEEDGE